MRSSGALLSITYGPERAVGDSAALVEAADAPHEACTAVTAISVSFSVSSRTNAQASRLPW